MSLTSFTGATGGGVWAEAMDEASERIATTGRDRIDAGMGTLREDGGAEARDYASAKGKEPTGL